jgi:hypothetical protein
MVGVQTSLSGRSVQLTSILRAQYASGKISLPVDGGLYARLKHVQGVPSQSSGGYSLSKLQMIDIMIERLVRLRGEDVPVTAPADDAEAGALIQSLAKDLHAAIRSVDTAGGSFAGGLLESGLLFDLVA